MNPLRSKVLRELVLQGPWVRRAQLAHLTTCPAALDDVLADLVMDGVAEFKQEHVGYRLQGGPTVAEARRRLLEEPQRVRAVVMRELSTAEGPQLVMGVAERRPELGGELLTYRVELPVAGSQSELIAQAQRFMDGWTRTRGGLAHV